MHTSDDISLAHRVEWLHTSIQGCSVRHAVLLAIALVAASARIRRADYLIATDELSRRHRERIAKKEATDVAELLDHWFPGLPYELRTQSDGLILHIDGAQSIVGDHGDGAEGECAF